MRVLNQRTSNLELSFQKTAASLLLYQLKETGHIRR